MICTSISSILVAYFFEFFGTTNKFTTFRGKLLWPVVCHFDMDPFNFFPPIIVSHPKRGEL